MCRVGRHVCDFVVLSMVNKIKHTCFYLLFCVVTDGKQVSRKPVFEYYIR